MTFLNPFWLPFCAVPLLLALVAIYVRRRRRENRNAFVSSPQLIKRLVSHSSPVPWWISTILIAAAATLSFIALAQPTNSTTTIELPSNGRQIYLAIDCSRSMLVKDLTPDRLTVAKTAALEIIEAFPAEKIGLLSFAGSAWMEAPLTSDHNALRESVLEMNQHTIPYGGSASDPLLKLVTNAQPEDAPSEALLIILSDGEFHSPPSAEQVREATSSGLRIFTLGFGTLEGDYIPYKNSRDGLYRDQYGRTILSSLKSETLEDIARRGNGAYFSGGDYSFIRHLSDSLSKMEGTETSSRSLVIHNHIYYLFLIPALILLFLASLTPHLWKLMKPAAPLLLLSCLFLPEAQGEPQYAATAPAPLSKQELADKDYFKPPPLIEKNQAEALLSEAKEYHAQAAEAKGENVQRYKFSQGAAEYKAQRFDNAIKSFSQSLLSEDTGLQSEAHYNLGNSLFKYGQQLTQAIPKLKTPEDQLKARAAVISLWEDALDHYSGTVNLSSEHARAKENYEYVKKQLEDIKEEQKQQTKQCQESGEGEPQEKEGRKGEKPGDGEGESDGEGFTEDELKEKVKEAKENGYDPTGEGQGQDQETEEESPSKPEESDRTEEQERRPGESKEDYAKRKLKEGSDSETGNLKSRRRRFSSPEKDW